MTFVLSTGSYSKHLIRGHNTEILYIRVLVKQVSLHFELFQLSGKVLRGQKVQKGALFWPRIFTSNFGASPLRRLIPSATRSRWSKCILKLYKQVGKYYFFILVKVTMCSVLHDMPGLLCTENESQNVLEHFKRTSGHPAPLLRLARHWIWPQHKQTNQKKPKNFKY